MNSTILTVWAAGWLAVTVAVALAAGRIGTARAGAWLVVLGLTLLTLEGAALTGWLALTGPRGDRDAMAGQITPMAQAHVIDAAVIGVATAVLLGWIATTALRRGERWAHRVLLWGFVVVAATQIATTVVVYSRGLPLPGPGGPGGGGLGWQPVAVGLVAWALGLWIARPSPVNTSQLNTGQPATTTSRSAPCP